MDLLADDWHPLRSGNSSSRSIAGAICRLTTVMYEIADQSWRDRPRVMSTETAELIAMHISDQARSHDLHRITLILHRSEPLLISRNLITRLAAATRASVVTR